VTDTVLLMGVGGALAVGGYFVYKATSQPTDVQADACAGDWTDLINPLCWASSASASVANDVNAVSNELNTVLIILAVVVILVIALLAFGPGTEHIAKGASLFV